MGAWSQIAALPNPRWEAASCVHDGKVYLLGGQSSFSGSGTTYQTTNYIYTPVGNTWSTGAAIPAALVGYAFSTADDGVHLIYPETRAHYAYDPDTNTWAARQSVPSVNRREAHYFTDAAGLFYMAGGRVTPGSGTSLEVHRYDPDTDSWATRANMPAPLAAEHPVGQAGVLGSDGKVYLGLGSFASGLLAYDVGADTWAKTSNMPEASSGVDIAVSRLPTGLVVTMPHQSFVGWTVGVFRRIDGYNPGSAAWSLGVIPDYPAGNYRSAIATEPGGVIYLLGGIGDNSSGTVAVATAWSYKQNEPPTAPTPRTLLGGVTVSTGGKNRASWTFNDPNAGDSQSAFNFYYRIVGDTSWTTVTKTTPNPWYDFDAGTLDADDYEWQVEVYDAAGEISPRTTSALFTAADPPAGPSITYPINGQTVEHVETIVWSAPAQDSYQIRRIADDAGDPDPSTVYYDTGEVAESLTRSLAVTFDVNDRFEHVQVRVRVGGLWSEWVGVQVDVTYTPPPTPTFTVYPDEVTGSLLVMIANPDPVGDEPPAAYNDVYVDDGTGLERKATEIATNTGWRHWTPRSGRDYAGSVVVVAVAANGTTASS